MITLLVCLLTNYWSCDATHATEPQPIQNAERTQSPDSNFHIYLCFGQSNMEGSAKIEAMDREVDRRLQVMQPLTCPNLERTQGRWYPAVPPLSQCHVGLSPADYFGRNMVAALPDSVRVGLIVVAIGGCDIRLFDKDNFSTYTDTYPEEWFQQKIAGYGGNPYQRLVDLAKAAQKDGVIKGFLLHQGETNTGNTAWPTYVEKIYGDLLKDLDLSEVPLLAGEVVHEDQGGKCARMNPIINTLPEQLSNAHVISSKGCDSQSDSIHFSSKGVRELGRRYAAKMLELNP
ncbi:sialate O-acetylesterase [Marinoscillum furvescens]|nr:sialate O-acetylesterase [Marinoscillum furvescens]